MRLGEKIRYLREVEGTLRGLDRELSQQETARLIGKELVKSISQSYLSQLESGARPHLTNSSRLLLARFFKVHPGYLVDDPEGFQNELMSDIGALEDKLDLWLIGGAERFRRDPALCGALLAVANHNDSRRCLLLLKQVLETPELVDRLCDALRPQAAGEGQRNGVVKPEQASTKRLIAKETATTSLQANEEKMRAMRSRKGAARSTRK